MINTSKNKTRAGRATGVSLRPGMIARLGEQLRSSAVVARLMLVVLLAVLMLAVTRGWSPPRDFRLRQIPPRDIVAAVEFKQYDERATDEAREKARRFAEAVYVNDPLPLLQLKETLLNEVSQLARAEVLEGADLELWQQYQPPRAEDAPAETEEEREAAFKRFQEELSTEDAQSEFSTLINSIFEPFEERGILETQPLEANSKQILVREVGKKGFEPVYAVRDLLIENVQAELNSSLNKRLTSLELAQHVFARLRLALPVTLELNADATRDQQDKVASEVEDIYRTYEKGAKLADAGEPLNESKIELLELGYQERLSQRGWADRFGRAGAVLWVYAALTALCGAGLYRVDPNIIGELPRYGVLLLCVLATVAGVCFAHGQAWQSEIVPLLMFAMTMAIAYKHQTATLLTGSVTLIVSIGLGLSLFDSLTLFCPAVCSIATLDSIRHRSKLLLVGLSAGLVAVATVLAIGSLKGLPILLTGRTAMLCGLWCLVAGSLMTCVLPLVERVFRVQTDLSLLELGDPSKELLQELVRRAPGTYNHSITVASIAEAAAESIGARGLLVRVGAYYHDIGKMLKPGYFIENQGVDGNQHDALVPAMSTLVIIAHVKDGADLARQNRLPEVIIDFILQHHGTTLVEYFYRQAQQNSEGDEESDVDETSFRYPGPKPQTKEAGVLMLADAVESASRSLVEPTPARIESLVEQIIQKRLEDGQFDECNLTLEEVHLIGESLIKSLTAVYHGRVKYPGQETA